MVKIAVDTLGGDYAPEQIVEGALQAAELHGIASVLTGDERRLKELIGDRPGGSLLEIVHAPEAIGMHESPVEAVRRKKDSSLVAAARLVKEGQASALVSAGSTGATLAAALFVIGRIKGVERPAITSLMPTLQGVSSSPMWERMWTAAQPSSAVRTYGSYLCGTCPWDPSTQSGALEHRRRARQGQRSC